VGQSSTSIIRNLDPSHPTPLNVTRLLTHSGTLVHAKASVIWISPTPDALSQLFSVTLCISFTI